LEPVTHFLTGACIGRAGLNRKTAYATLVTTLAAEFPDIDVLLNFRGPLVAFQHHRGLTHTLAGLPFNAAVVLAAVYGAHRWRAARGHSTILPVRWGLLYVYGLIAGVSHILLDFTNNYGVRPFEPLNWTWYSWDIVFIIEPVILAVLLIGLLMPGLFSLVGQEVAGRRERFRGRVGALFALISIVLIWGVRDFYHRKAVTALEYQNYNGEDPKRVAAMPYPANPFRWAAIVETENTFQTMDVDALNGIVDPQGRAQVYGKPEETPVTLTAKKSWLGHIYLSWAKFPLVETEPVQEPPGGHLVRFRDLRFAYFPIRIGNPTETEMRRVLGASVLLDKDLNVVEMKVGTRIQNVPD
jgi:inner membrane protein